MEPLGDRILAAIAGGPLDDDALAERLGVAHRQSVNQTARRLARAGRLRRVDGPGGKIVNVRAEGPVPGPPAPAVGLGGTDGQIGEDEVKAAVADFLEADGFEVAVAWGRTRGIDVDARHPDGRRFVIEAKGEVSLRPQQVNYFLGALGELVQRMEDPAAVYGLALPGNAQYRGLAARLPALARNRLGLVVFWVVRGPEGLGVQLEA